MKHLLSFSFLATLAISSIGAPLVESQIIPKDPNLKGNAEPKKKPSAKPVMPGADISRARPRTPSSSRDPRVQVDSPAHKGPGNGTEHGKGYSKVRAGLVTFCGFFKHFKRIGDDGQPLDPNAPPRDFKVFGYIPITDVSYGNFIRFMNLIFIVFAFYFLIVIACTKKIEPKRKF
ncbi:membrane protein insertase YidC [Babesia caballi]|uniref:Membrane protein insertase YidC n=1 Tax=Babesia caballi TaxID=5871 RepID=A0AAV4LQ82_BABCB|nr:membrane protein insertase YidC [Babesia caballi]